MGTPVKVLFVCLGNICRSPLAEGIFRKKASERKLGHLLHADSCGTADYHIGNQPDSRTVRNAAKNGVMLDHRCRQISREDFRNFDHIIAMDENNHRNILSIVPSIEHHGKVRLMRDWDTLPGLPGVPDPYYGDEKDFQEVFEILDRCMDKFIDHLTDSVTAD